MCLGTPKQQYVLFVWGRKIHWWCSWSWEMFLKAAVFRKTIQHINYQKCRIILKLGLICVQLCIVQLWIWRCAACSNFTWYLEFVSKTVLHPSKSNQTLSKDSESLSFFTLRTSYFNCPDWPSFIWKLTFFLQMIDIFQFEMQLITLLLAHNALLTGLFLYVCVFVCTTLRLRRTSRLNTSKEMQLAGTFVYRPWLLGMSNLILF